MKRATPPKCFVTYFKNLPLTLPEFNVSLHFDEQMDDVPILLGYITSSLSLVRPISWMSSKHTQIATVQ